MALTMSLAGFPPVIRARVRGGCGSTPGRATIECVIGNGTAEAWPDTTTFTMSDGTTTLSWVGMRMIGSPRVRSGKMRVILEDSRWKLRHVLLGTDYNQLDSAGVSLVPTQATMAQLAAVLATKTSLTINAGTVPAFVPPAKWRGITASTAMERLLADAVCRLHYSPVNGQYSIWAAGAGPYPALTNRMFISSPARGIRTIYVRSAPILYERKMAATAVVENGAGQIVNVADNYPNEYFSGFPSVTNDVLKERLRQSAYRLWKVAATNRHLKNHRALSILSGSGDVKFLGAKMTRDALASQMKESEVSIVESLSHRDETGHQVYHTPWPLIRANGTSIDTSAEILAAYHLDGTGGLQREVQSRSIAASGTDRNFDVHWLRPIDSDQDDVPTTQWSTYLGAVADALDTAFTPNPHTVTLPGIVVAPPSGHIGAIEYYAEIRPLPNLLTRIALDFDANPGDLS